MSSNSSHVSSPVTAVLGPTNTGKTHLAIERMLGYETGMIGFPLRLLAREVYDRIVKLKGAGQVALITGEEKILPPDPAYYICTVEAMPISKSVDFMAIDEIQLAADAERGHIFTDRLLHARGNQETMLLGAATMVPMIKQLLPKAHIISRPRLSTLSYAGSKKLSRLPRRTAITSFSVDSVYAIAEVVRQQKGGAAVVMGALSPRTRNAQVDMYQSGEVDFMVATDAIGMGLNMDVDHVAFAQTRKFDGRNHRELVAAELAQVAGRAGRHTSDGTFGVTGEMPALEDSLVEQIENNIFEPIRRLMWRNPNLDFSSVEALKISLEASPPTRGLIRVPITIDMQALNMMTTDPSIKDRAEDENSIRLLWEVAQIPDFRKTIIGEHASILGDIFLFLSGDQAILPAKWIEERIARCDRTDGDLDTLGSRLAHIRTWTYVTQKNGWVENQRYWQAQARQVEDKLSDALHQGLMKQFVDTRSSILLKRLQGRDEAEAEIDAMGDVHVEGEYAGRIEGLHFTKDNRMTNSPPRTVRAAIEKVVGQELRNRASELAACPDDELKLNEQGEIFWHQSCIAKLVAGRNLLSPAIKLLADESLVGTPRNQIEAKLAAFVRRHLDTLLAPLIIMKVDESLNGLARGLAFQIVEHGGHIPRANIAETLSEIDQPARAGLRKLGLRFGTYDVFMPALLKPGPARGLAMLWSHFNNRNAVEDLVLAPAPGLTSCVRKGELPDGFYRSLGFRIYGKRAIRLDMLERLADLIRKAIEANNENNEFEITADMVSLMGCSHDEMAEILKGLGYVSKPKPQEENKSVNEDADNQTPNGDLVENDVGEEKPKENNEQKVTLLWFPKKRRARKAKPKKKTTKNQNAVKKSGQTQDKRRNKSTSKQNYEKKMDPNSPFAVLQSLKDNNK